MHNKAVDNMDRMSENYTVARRSNRWPLTVFYSILNIGAVNAQVIHHENSQTKYTRLQFLKILAKQLMDHSYNIVQQYFHFHKILKTRLNIYGYKPTLQVGKQRVRASGRCQFCDRQRDRKTTKVCTNCAKLICRDHLVEKN
ncbi:piggyBac transposable element-derived protein 4-like, partial [Aphis craccivora]